MKFESNVLEVDEDIKEKEDAKMAVMCIRDEVAIMGFNDYEIPAIDKIVEDLEADRMTPAEAVEAAWRIKASKQDYH